MSSIHKLGIIGIRSYSPEEEVVIKFFKPLTLILGKNGAGKTTIIECLKMAVAGSFPPNSQQGKTFVCDPKLVGRPEVKAKIEIAFTAVNLRKILGVRTFQLTNTAKKSEFRQMEQVLKAKDLNGDIISVTQKCAEMDRQIPELLGVSQAVLDNVIFCHQEESLWPFGDTAKLKSIFDELFDTTRYTTLLENLKKVQKEYKKMAKESLNSFELDKKDFDILMRTQKTALKDASDINILQKQLDESNKKIRALKDKMKPVESKSEIERSLNIIRFRISELKRQRDTLLSALETAGSQVFNENSMEELNRCKQELAVNYKRKEEELAGVEEKLEDLRKNKDALQRQLDQIQYLERDQSEINIKIKDYRERILQLITLDLVGNETDAKLNEKVLNKAQSQLETMSKEVASESERLEEQEQNMENDLNNFRSSLSSKEGLIENNENELRSTNLKIQKLTTDLDKFNKQNKGSKKNLDDDLEGVDDSIENLKENLTIFNENKDRRTKELVEISEKMRNNAKNKELMLKYQDYSSLQKELNAADQDYKNNEDELWMLSKNLSDISNNEFQTGDTTDDLIQAVYVYENELETKKEILEKKKEKANDTVKEVNSYLQIKQNDLNDKLKINDEFASKMENNKLQALLEGDGDFLTQYKSIKDQLEKVEKRDLTMKYTEDIMRQLLDRSQKNKKCAFCTRKLDESELQKVVTKCQEIVSKSKNFTANEQRSLEELKHQKSLFKSMKNEYEEFRKNRAIITQLKSEIQAKEKEKNISQQQLNNLKTSLTNTENIKANISNILKVYEKLEKAQDEKTKVKVKIEQLLRVYPGLKEYRASSMSLDDRELQTRIEAINSDIGTLTERINHTNNEITRLQQQKDEMEKKKTSQQRDSFDIENKTKELETLKARRTELEESIKKLNDEVNILRNRTEGLEEKRKQIRIARKQLDEKKNTRFLRLKEFTEEYKRLYDIWVRSQDKKKKNSESDALKDRLSKEIQSANDDVEKGLVQLQKLKENIKEKNINMKLIDDNIQLRTFETEMDELKAELEKLEKNYEEIRENERYNTRIQTEIDKEYAGVNQTEGKSSRIRDEYDKSMGELKNKWGTTEKSYIEKLFEANVNQYVVEDLDIYIANLEKALMLFHKQKMAEINKIIADLWIKTYQGTDIRKIEIKSDTEPNSRNKSFNYRIVFFNPDGKELDMKGRCSMGQKVIASIVIRLALAEAFCTHCGILALDEPTTNLDKDHIKKLAKELCNLIEERMNNENFQLILITHDKEFLRQVSEHAEEYYRVYKDNNAFSKIERKRTSAL